MRTLSFSAWKDLLRNTLTLKPEPIEFMASTAASLRTAIYIVVVVGLVIGGVQALFGIPALISGPSFNTDEFVSQMNQQFDMFNTFGGEMPPEFDAFVELFKESITGYAPVIQELMQVSAPLPGIFGRMLAWLGAWLSAPFALLASWLFISTWIMLFARLLGGRGTLLAYLGASSLSTLPHLLHAFDFVPCLNAIIWLVAGIWGLVIQVKVVEYTHGLGQGRAILSVILFYLLLAIIAGLGVSLAFIAILIGAIGS